MKGVNDTINRQPYKDSTYNYSIIYAKGITIFTSM